MKKLAVFFSAICLVAAGILLVYNFVFPIAYRIKEPHFKMPVEVSKEIIRIEDLPIRSDLYGDGTFDAKRRNGRKHGGVDIEAKIGSPVYASKSGWAKSDFIPTGYGHLVIIDHPGKYQTRYGHLQNSVVGKFKWVGQGELIGFVGKTGNACFNGIVPHLHFEIRHKHKGDALDPAKELTKAGGKI